MLKIEILYFDGCPTYLEAENNVREALAEEGIEAEVRLVALNTDEEARGLRFPGSPTIRANGRDLFPVPRRPEYALGCRVYATPEGLKGSPTTEVLREALTTADGAHAENNPRGRRTLSAESRLHDAR